MRIGHDLVVVDPGGSVVDDDGLPGHEHVAHV
jgi:hypothetical protein